MRHSCEVYTSKTKITLFLIISAIMIFTLSACQQSQATPTRDVAAVDVQVNVATPTKKPYPFKTSEPGTTTVHGILLVLDPMTLLPDPDDAIYLVPLAEDAQSIPQFKKGEVPQAEVDETSGEFMFTNIQPGYYAVVVITQGGAQIPSRFYQTGSYALFNVDQSQADTTIELDKLSLP